MTNRKRRVLFKARDTAMTSKSPHTQVSISKAGKYAASRKQKNPVYFTSNGNIQKIDHVVPHLPKDTLIFVAPSDGKRLDRAIQDKLRRLKELFVGF